MIVMFNMGIRPEGEEIRPHRAAEYKIETHICDQCNHQNELYIHVPGIAKKFETKDEMLAKIREYASNMWDRMEEIHAQSTKPTTSNHS